MGTGRSQCGHKRARRDTNSGGTVQYHDWRWIHKPMQVIKLHRI